MRVPLQVILAILFVFFSGETLIAQETRAPEKGPILRLVYFLSNALARDSHFLYSRIIVAGDLDGDGVDEIMIRSRHDPDPKKRKVLFYIFKKGNFQLADSVPEDGIMKPGVVTDIDGDSRKEGIYYAYVYDPKDLDDAFVVIRRAP